MGAVMRCAAAWFHVALLRGEGPWIVVVTEHQLGRHFPQIGREMACRPKILGPC